MHIWAFDVGQKFGWASGSPGACPDSGVWRLKKPAEHPSIAGSNLIFALNDRWASRKPDLVCKEAPLNLEAFKRLGNAAHTVRMTLGLHDILEAMCVRFGVPFESVHDATIRKHFIGRGRLGSREETKRAVVQRCHLLGFMPRECGDDNRADAIATFDYAAATWGKSRDQAIHLFGEKVA